MTEASTSNTPDVPDWHAQYLRFIVFTSESQLSTDRNWWKELTNEDPESDTKTKKDRSQLGGFLDGQLSVTVDPVRIQWTLLTPFSLEDFGEIGLLGAFHDRIGPFTDLMKQWLKVSPPIRRLAVVATLFKPMPSREAAYRHLDEILEVVDVDPATSDFLYRVNRIRPSKSGVTDLVINRLATWGAVKILTEVRPLSSIDKEFSCSRDEKQFCHLELDISTSVERKEPIPSESLDLIISELAEVAKETAQHGDRRGGS